MNRLFIEPCLGLGYPEKTLPILKKLRSLYKEGDEERMIFDFDFYGVQYYFRTVARKYIMPGMRAKEVVASKRGVPANEMEREKYPKDYTRYSGKSAYTKMSEI